jgi:hypothetical protein
MLLCAKHHRLLHEGGFSIKKNYKDQWYFETSQGKVVPDAPVYQFPADEIGFDEVRESGAYYHASRDVQAGPWVIPGSIQGLPSLPL